MSEPKHPAHAALDEIWNHGGVPRVIIDVTADGLVFPAHVLARHKDDGVLAIDLDARYPLNFGVDSTCFCVDLAFAGHVLRCTIPWAAVRVIGALVEEHAPPLPKSALAMNVIDFAAARAKRRMLH